MMLEFEVFEIRWRRGLRRIVESIKYEGGYSRERTIRMFFGTVSPHDRRSGNIKRFVQVDWTAVSGCTCLACATSLPLFSRVMRTKPKQQIHTDR